MVAVACWCIAPLCAQTRLPVPDAAAQAAVQSELLEIVAEEMTSPGPSATGACDRLIARAATADSPVLRFCLL